MELVEDGNKGVVEEYMDHQHPKEKVTFSLEAVLYAMLMTNNSRKMMGLLSVGVGT